MNGNKTIKTYNYETDISSYSVKAELTYCVDHHYGADADGNRGITQSDHDIDILSITPEDSDVDLLPRLLKKPILGKIYDWLYEQNLDQTFEDEAEFYAEEKADRLR